MKSHWVDVNLEMYEYMEARVEALSEENKKLRWELNFLKELDKDLKKASQDDEYPLPSVLVC
jgi:cell division protein FtsB